MNESSVVNFSVPRSVKNAWVKRSQSFGMKLTDWVSMILNREIDNPFSFYPSPKRSDAPVLVEHLVVSLGWSLGELATFLDVSLEDARSFMNGDRVRSISPAVFDLLLLLANRHPDLKLSPRYQMVESMGALESADPKLDAAKPDAALVYSATARHS